MANYSSDHAGALADIRAAGAPVSFTLHTPGTHNAATGTSSAPSTSVVRGHAIEVKKLSPSDHRAYEAAGLKPSEAPMLLFAAETFGDVPALSATCEWGGRPFVVRAFGDRVAPDGVPILTRPIIAS